MLNVFRDSREEEIGILPMYILHIVTAVTVTAEPPLTVTCDTSQTLLILVKLHSFSFFKLIKYGRYYNSMFQLYSSIEFY